MNNSLRGRERERRRKKVLPLSNVHLCMLILMKIVLKLRFTYLHVSSFSPALDERRTESMEQFLLASINPLHVCAAHTHTHTNNRNEIGGKLL
jgi:hypothetical protein